MKGKKRMQIFISIFTVLAFLFTSTGPAFAKAIELTNSTPDHKTSSTDGKSKQNNESSNINLTGSKSVNSTTNTDDYGNDFSSAAPIQIGIINNGRIDYTNDVDVFKFTSADAGKYYINLTPNFSCSYGVDAYNSSQKRIQVYKDNSFYINASAKQTYYIKTMISGGIGPYTIRVTEISAPTAPTNLKVTQTTTSAVSISWAASKDNVGLTGYDVYRDGAIVGTTDQLAYTDTGLSSNTQYTYTVKAKDASDNVSAASSQVTGKTAIDTDKVPPTAPTNLAVSSKTARSITLSWNPATDNGVVVGYDVYCNGTKVGTSAKTSYTCTGLIPNSTYSFKVQSRDAAGNVSTDSNSVSDTTYNDDYGDDFNTAAPIQVGIINNGVMNNTDDVDVFKFTSADAGKYNIYLTPNFSCSYGIAAYNGSQQQIQVYNDNNNGFYINASADQTYYIKTMFTGGTGPYIIRVTETVPPTVPTNLKITETSTSTLSLTWSASTDNVGINEYKIFRNDTEVGTTTQLNYTDTGLTSNTSYTYTIKAVDLSDNISAASSPIIGKTDVDQDKIPPTAPTNLAVTSKTARSITLSWNAATDNVVVVGYDVYCNGTKVGTSATTSYTCTGLTPNSTYSFKVQARDAAENLSPDSDSVSGTTYNDDYGDDFNSAAPIQIGIINNGIIDYADDVDLFKFTSADAGRYNISLTPNFSCSYGVDVYNSSQQQIQVYNDNNKGFYINTDANQTYYIKTLFTGGTGPYTIRVTDTVPPTAPTNLKATEKSTSTISLSWSASTDNVGISEYEIYRNNDKVGTTTQLSYQDTCLASNTEYTYTVKAKDASDNISDASNSVIGKTDIDTDKVVLFCTINQPQNIIIKQTEIRSNLQDYQII